MGKKQHQKDKLYLTTTEWSQFYGGKKTSTELNENSEFKRLPFSYCSLSMQAFETPYCTPEGHIFDIIFILPFLKQFGINPINGQKLLRKDLIKLNFFKNNKGQYHCPVTFKVFNENSHIVAIRNTGNVFAFEAVERLNIKANFWKDLINDETFKKDEIITLQDPKNLTKFNYTKFYHVEKNLKVDNEDDIVPSDPLSTIRKLNTETKQILQQLNQTYKPQKENSDVQVKADKINAAHYSLGKAAASLTSTAVDPTTLIEPAIIDEDTLRYARVKKKGYVQMVTNLGQLNLEIHSDMVPKTSENFIRHCLEGYYDGTIFHRSIRNFMIQGGDPEGTGRGGESVWGEPFKDEFDGRLKHKGRGILSMANSGPNTNKSQFFITYRSAGHLDNKHSVFGGLVGGLNTLSKMEDVVTDKKDRPLEQIKIIKCHVFFNPFEEADKMLEEERMNEKNKKDEEKEKIKKKEKAKNELKLKEYSTGIGKYINPSLCKRIIIGEENDKISKKKKTNVNQFNFNSW